MINQHLLQNSINLFAFIFQRTSEEALESTSFTSNHPVNPTSEIVEESVFKSEPASDTEIAETTSMQNHPLYNEEDEFDHDEEFEPGLETIPPDATIVQPGISQDHEGHKGTGFFNIQ